MITELNELIANMLFDYPNWRYGQAVFNAMSVVSPEAAEFIRGTDNDPYYWDRNDERFVAFWDWYLNHTGDFE